MIWFCMLDFFHTLTSFYENASDLLLYFHSFVKIYYIYGFRCYKRWIRIHFWSYFYTRSEKIRLKCTYLWTLAFFSRRSFCILFLEFFTTCLNSLFQMVPAYYWSIAEVMTFLEKMWCFISFMYFYFF